LDPHLPAIPWYDSIISLKKLELTLIKKKNGLIGTTWTSELAWLIMNDCNYEEAARVPLSVRSPNIE
jgi:hypothetical protein